MSGCYINGKWIDTGDDDQELILDIAKTIEEQNSGHMIDRWEFELTDAEKAQFLHTAAVVYRRLVGRGLLKANQPVS